jgi:hypothetical protein
MKKLVALMCALFIALPVWSQSYDEAESLWEGRGENVVKALEASDMYKALSNTEVAGSYEQAEALLLQTETLFFYADASSNIDVKKKFHGLGEDIALRAGGMFKNLGDDENLALSYFWAGAHLGKWGLANGVLASLFKVKKLMKHIAVIKNAGGQELMSYGYNRLLGRLFFKLPWPKGDKKEALRLAKEGYEKTINEDFGVSEHGLNNIYYAEYLIQSGNKAEAKRILKSFVAITNYEDFNSERMPETKIEQATARKLLNNL